MSTTAATNAAALVERLLQVATDNGSDELRLSGGRPPMLHVGGQIRPLKMKPVSDDDIVVLSRAASGGESASGGFSYSGAAGHWHGKLVDAEGTKVLVFQRSEPPAAEEPPPLELALDDDEPATAAPPTDDPGDGLPGTPRVASGSIHIDKLLEAAVRGGVSDIHITVGQPPVFRIDGGMKPQATKVLTAEDTDALMKSITPERCMAELAEQGGCDFGFAFGDKARFRVSVFKQRGQIAMVLRQIPNKMLTPEQLGVPEVCKKLVTRPRGLFLVTGPTGSGKSTTLASLIDFINQNYDHHIITIEDPIEFYHHSKKSTVNQREVGNDVPSFSEALRRALRQDPDVILVGELRDLETIEAAISAAETGHVVFGTLHTTGAQGTVNRIIDAFPTNQQEQIRTQLSTAILGVVSQALLPKIGGGRVAAYEVLVVTSAIGNLIRENKTFRINSAIQTGAKLGMQLLDDHLFRLWNEKKVAEEDVMYKAQNPDDLMIRIANAKRGVFDDNDDGGRD